VVSPESDTVVSDDAQGHSSFSKTIYGRNIPSWNKPFLELTII